MDRFQLRTERLGPLPIINHFIEKLGLESLLERHVPTSDPRVTLPYFKGLGVLLRSILVEREPIYRQQETVSTFAPTMFGLVSGDVEFLSDDRIGRALDKLFDADRGSLLTEAIIAAGNRFGVKLDELHNDSTTIRFSGQYRGAKGRSIRGRRAPWITYGLSKDHRPDLKQLLFVLTVTAGDGIPVQFRCEDGQTNDTRTRIETWDALNRVAGRPDFLYVADSKLCTRENMDYIDRKKGRFVTVIPRNRLEDGKFREWLQTHEPDWQKVWDRPNPRRKHGPRDRWWVFQPSLPSREGWPVTWVFSSLLAFRQENTRWEHLTRAEQELEDLKNQLAGPRNRLKKRVELEERVEKILGRLKVKRYLRVRLLRKEEHRFKQERKGRPGPNTRYQRITKRRWDIEWKTDEEAIAFDRRSDGMYPLLTNDRSLTPAEVLEAHKQQPVVEKRFRQTKSVYEIAPVFLKNEGRIEALFFIYFLALLIQALIERELRLAMERESMDQLPLYPEERSCRRPTSEQVFRLFSLAARYTLFDGERKIQVFETEFTELQRQIMDLLRVPGNTYYSE